MPRSPPVQLPKRPKRRPFQRVRREEYPILRKSPLTPGCGKRRPFCFSKRSSRRHSRTPRTPFYNSKRNGRSESRGFPRSVQTKASAIPPRSPLSIPTKADICSFSFSPFAPESQGSVLPAARYKAYHSSLVRRMSAPLQSSFSRPASVVPDTA